MAKKNYAEQDVIATAFANALAPLKKKYEEQEPELTAAETKDAEALTQTIKIMQGMGNSKMVEALKKERAVILGVDHDARRKEITAALVDAANEVGLEITAKPQRARKNTGGSSGATRTRRNADQLEKDRAAIIKALGKKTLSIADIAAASGVEGASADVNALVKDGVLEQVTQGTKGRGGEVSTYKKA